MSTNRILKRIGGKLREQSRDIVDVELPEAVRTLLIRLACVDSADQGAIDPRVQENRRNGMRAGTAR